MNSVVITGATSFLGSATARALLERGWTVYAQVRPDSPNMACLPTHPNLIVVPGTLADMAGIRNLAQGSRIWYHFAWGATKPEERNDETVQRQNVDGSMEAVAIAQSIGCRTFVFPGSQAEYGVHSERITEQTTCQPVSAYGKAKLAFGDAAQARCAQLGMTCIRLRIFSVYGVDDHACTLVSSCIRTFLQGQRMELSHATQTWNFLNIQDFAALMVRMAEQPVAGTYNVAGRDTRMLKSFIEQMHALCGNRGECRYGEMPAKPEGQVQLDPDISKVEQTFGWRPQILFEDGIRAIITRQMEKEK